MIINIVKIFLPATLAFFIGIAITPILTHFFYKHKMWKRYARSESLPPNEYQIVYSEKKELSTPRVGGSVIWLSAVIVIFILFLISVFFPSTLSLKLSFLSRNQTILPLFTFLFSALIGLADDLIQIYGKKAWAHDAISLRWVKIGTITLIGAIVGWWFYYKLGIVGITIPFDGFLPLGILFIPFFILIMLAVFSSSVIDGLDGLSGGILATIFGAYTIIAFSNNQIDLAAFCAVIVGGLLAFLWFNIPPARFYMGETGMIGLTATLATIAFLTDTVLILPIIAFPLVITSLSVIIQLLSKKFRHGKRVFRLTPLHHHFEALGWPSYKVTMRFWVVSVIFAIIGVIFALIS